VEGSCEHGNETSGSIIYWEILEWLRNWQLLKKYSATWSLQSIFRICRYCRAYVATPIRRVLD
jgi:hypothetical protein